MKQTKRYLVDSDILIDGLRKKQAAADYLDSLGDWSYSIASAMELFAGARNKQESRRSRNRSLLTNASGFLQKSEKEDSNSSEGMRSRTGPVRWTP